MDDSEWYLKSALGDYQPADGTDAPLVPLRLPPLQHPTFDGDLAVPPHPDTFPDLLPPSRPISVLLPEAQTRLAFFVDRRLPAELGNTSVVWDPRRNELARGRFVKRRERDVAFIRGKVEFVLEPGQALGQSGTVD